MFIKILYCVFNKPADLCVALLSRCAAIIPDKLYLKLVFRLKMGYWMDFDNPKTFNEKLQWLKIYNRRPEYTKMVDKFAVKEYAANVIGWDYIIPTLGVWDRFEDIDFEIEDGSHPYWIRLEISLKDEYFSKSEKPDKENEIYMIPIYEDNENYSKFNKYDFSKSEIKELSK